MSAGQHAHAPDWLRLAALGSPAGDAHRWAGQSNIPHLSRTVTLIAAFKNRVHILKREACALYVAARDPRVPWYAKVFMALVLAHTFSPIDLIPDFIPVLGYLDDLVVTPVGIALALKMIPSEAMTDARQQAEELMRQGKPISRAGAIMVVAIWLTIITVVVWSILGMVMS